MFMRLLNNPMNPAAAAEMLIRRISNNGFNRKQEEAPLSDCVAHPLSSSKFLSLNG
jgi:hypothetical protein